MFLAADRRTVGRTPIELIRKPKPSCSLRRTQLLLIQCRAGDLATMLTAGARPSEEAHVGAEMRRIGPLLLLLGGLMAGCTGPTATGPVAASATPRVIGTPAQVGPDRARPLGARTITRADEGSTLRIAVGEVLILRLSGDTAWDVQITDPRVVAADHAATPAPGEQGIYRARIAGVTELVAVAVPPCAKDRSPCEVMAPAFRLLIVVR